MMGFEIARVVAVIVLLGVAAVLTTPKGRLPLALRGICRIMKRDCGENAAETLAKVPPARRMSALLLVIAAIALALVK